VPAPTAYNMPATEIFRPKAPAFVFGSRTPLYSKKISPGPIYLLPRAIGPKIPDKLAAAECTLKGDRKCKDPKFSPGPIYDVDENFFNTIFTLLFLKCIYIDWKT
jgi:hypothetical protein